MSWHEFLKRWMLAKVTAGESINTQDKTEIKKAEAVWNLIQEDWQSRFGGTVRFEDPK